MAVQVNVSGLTAIKIQTTGSLLTLGYSRNEVEVSLNHFLHDIPGDENGGEAGPPVDIQSLGATATIRLRMSKYDPAVFAYLEGLVATQSSTPGEPATPGALLLSGSGTSVRCLLHSTTDPRNFPLCIVREAVEFNKGTKYTEASVVLEAHKNAAGVLWNLSTS